MGERAGNISYKPHEFKQDPYKTAKVCFHCGNSMNNPRANHTGAVPDKRSGPRLAKDSSPNSRRARLHRALDAVMDRGAARDAGTIGNPYFHGQFEVGDVVTLRGNPGARYKVIKFEGNGSVLVRMLAHRGPDGVERWGGPLTVVNADKAERGEIKKV